MSNWEQYIFELIENMTNGSLEEITYIRKEIDTAYKFGFIDYELRMSLKQYVFDYAKEVNRKNDILHMQNMYDIEMKQKKLREQLEIKELLSKADDEWKVKNVRRGRKRTTTSCLYMKNN